MKKEWIDVNEQLPENWVNVLVFDKYGTMFIAAHNGGGLWYADDSGINVYGAEYEIDRENEGVTHWQPLPDKPPTN